MNCKKSKLKAWLYTEGYYCDSCQDENNNPCEVEE